MQKCLKRKDSDGKEKDALTGNRTRASRVAGENSTTEPSVLAYFYNAFSYSSYVCTCMYMLCVYGRQQWRKKTKEEGEEGGEVRDRW